MRRPSALLALCVLLSACTGTSPGTSPSATVSDPASSVPRPTSSSSAGPSGSPTPALPPGVPATFSEDLPAGDVPLKALIPEGTTADGRWYATMPTGDAILVAFGRPTQDPFRAERGFAIWRHFPDPPFWRAVSGQRYAPDEGVLSIQATIGDVTGDGAPDALVEALTGGSGTCGTWRVMDLTSGAALWRRDLCDARVMPASNPVGLAVSEAVYGPGDAHCCPGATRTTLLTYTDDGRWAVASKVTTPTGGLTGG